MDDSTDERPPPITGPAVIGQWTYLCWSPCHRESVRLQTKDFEPWMAVVVQCRRCKALWTVEFPTPPPGAAATALWRPVARRRDEDEGS